MGNRRSTDAFGAWQNDVSGNVVGLIETVIFMAAWLAFVVLSFVLGQIWRVYKTHVFDEPDSPTAQFLWKALAAFIAVLVLSLLVGTSSPGATAAALGLAACSFVVFAVVVVLAPLYAGSSTEKGKPDQLIMGETGNERHFVPTYLGLGSTHADHGTPGNGKEPSVVVDRAADLRERTWSGGPRPPRITL